VADGSAASSRATADWYPEQGHPVTDDRDKFGELAGLQAALRRVATLVARGVPASEVFATVAEELARALGASNASLWRYESDGAATLISAHDDPLQATTMPVGSRWPLDGENIVARIFDSGRPTRMDTHDNAAGWAAARIRELGLHSGVGAPIVVEGRLWGAAVVGSAEPRPFSPDTENRVTDFADLVATAIANADARDALRASRDELHELAELQAALRRVATLVARAVEPSELFKAVAEEMSRHLGAELTALWRYQPDGSAILVATNVDADPHLPVGTRMTLEGENLLAMVLQTGRPARQDSIETDNASGSTVGLIREIGLRTAVGAPIVVDRRVWGMAGLGSTNPDPLPADTEERVSDFADLVAIAIANAAARDDLIASRARIVAAADGARRRLERDLHDGAQQRLVSLGLQLRLAEGSAPPKLQEQLAGVVSGLTAVSQELQQISRGIHPAILSKGGLGPALKTLARRCPVPVHVDVAVERRLPEPVEVAAYYVVAEALTNAAKYAQASEVNVCAETKGASLDLSIHDDGIGGADSRKGSGLIGLKDRVEVLGGHMQIASHPGSGTSLHVTIPVAADASRRPL
jgi:signal transduction histidine kinase